ncbi:tetratricopeptide repeat protein [Saccharothrix longispora]|uniref:Tetratricopeptide (TPR) repeat protein n=1 Tax=Saccharothrix longispora TaxID=33920 RepID=A0ABU1PSK7_9PSEU|nr:tetratricopeptide repeat protein [Saccharothrix longispora]MDR6593576.1 tetratricopeptide (TPR) repeat protein [Saccharothrix longispora]
MHRTIVVVDVEGFGDARRTLPHQVATRAGLYRVVADALGAAGVPWEDCYHEDRGDGVVVLVPPEYAKAPLVEVLPEVLARELRAHNDTSPAAQRTRLRVAVHAGEVVFDRHGVTSTAVTTAFRLLDAPQVKQALADSPGLIALVVSRWLFDEVVRHSAVLDPATFRPVRVRVKEVRDTAWTALPDSPYPADPAVLDQPSDPVTAGDTGGAIPRQLPGAPALFVGREEYLADLDRALTPLGDDPATATAVVISAIGGAGGIGKTWLALHWAHRHSHRFPDGQMFIDLRGFSPDDQPLHSSVAVRGFLDALGVDPSRLPTDLDAQAALYRSLVAGKRMLIVLDNAATADQVAPLLPGTPTCTVLVTGRRKLASLIDRHGARHVQMGLLSQQEARALLTERLGGERLDTEPGATDELIELCGCHPLALAIMVRHASTLPKVPLAEFGAELRDLGLDMLDDDDPSASLPAVLSWSLRHLTEQQQMVFALLGTAPGPDIDLPAAASLTGLPEARTRKALRVLEDCSLLDRHPHGRYRMHDLVRAYATTTAHDRLPEQERQAALERVVDFYLHTAHAADQLLDPNRPQIAFGPPAPGTSPQPLPDLPSALAWLDAHHSHLLAAQHTAATCHRHQAVWHLAWTLTNFHQRRGHRHDELTVWLAAVDVTAHLADPLTRALVHRFVGRAYAVVGRHEQAIGHLDQALSLARRHHEPTQQAHTHFTLARTWGQQGDYRRALEHAEDALTLVRTHGTPLGEADALNQMGWYAACLGHYDTAREHCQAALTLHRRHYNPVGEAATQDSLGYIAHHTGRHREAIHHYRQALTLRRTLGNTTQTTDTLDNLGHPHAALGQHQQARSAWQEALTLYRKQGRDTDARRVQQQLDDLDAATNHHHGATTDPPPPATPTGNNHR